MKETETGEATELSLTHATLSGSLNPTVSKPIIGSNTGPNTRLNTRRRCHIRRAAARAGPSKIPVSVSVTLPTDVSAEGPTYYYQLLAENEFGISYGETKTFHVPPAVKGVTTLKASQVNLTSVTLNGSFEPQGEPTSYYFEWGKNAAYGNSVPVGPPGVNSGDSNGVEKVEAELAGLETGVTYHYRVVAVNARGATAGADETVLPGGAPSISSARVTEINTDTAELKA